ncbi:MAG: hypothetical protein HYV40_01850 [Candidatus Levybacteria bacterium]|nr:hypothetical protein [Candidatus Levybacteria bacterium]
MGRSKLAFLILGLLSIGIVSLLFFNIFFPTPPLGRCSQLRLYFYNNDCGYISTTQDGVFHSFIGRLLEKNKEKDRYYLTIGLKNSKGKPFTEKFVLAPEEVGISVEWLLPHKQRLERANVVKAYSPKFVFDQLKVDSELSFFIDTPDKEIISKARERFKDEKYFNCFAYHPIFVRFMKDSTFRNNLERILYKFNTGCLASINQLRIPR